MDGWPWLDTHIRSLQLWNCMKLCETRAKTLVPRVFCFFGNCWWKAPNVCGAKGCEWLSEGLYKRCDSSGSRRLCIFHLAVGRGKGRTRYAVHLSALHAANSFQKGIFFWQRYAAACSGWYIHENGGISMISLSPVLPCMTCTWLKPQLYSFEIRFHCTSFPVSILQEQIFMSCRVPSLHIPSSGKCARLFLNPGHFVSGHARPAHACTDGWWWGAYAATSSYESYEQLCGTRPSDGLGGFVIKGVSWMMFFVLMPMGIGSIQFFRCLV